jgi:hypothetical protein
MKHLAQILTGPPAFTPKLTPQGLVILDAHHQPLLQTLDVHLSLAGERTLQLDTQKAHPTGPIGLWSINQLKEGLSVQWRIYTRGPALLCWANIQNQSPHRVTVAGCTLFAARWPQSAVPRQLRQSGYQSWSPATPKMALADRLALPRPAMMRAPGCTGIEMGIVQPDYLEVETDSQQLWMGFISAHTATGVIRLTPDWHQNAHLSASQPLGTLSLRPGQRLRLDTWCLIDAQATDALHAYAALSSFVMRGKKTKQRQLGWCSWYHYFENIQAKDIVENLEHLTHAERGLESQVVLVDDGYQQAVGDWLTPNARFDGHPAAIAQTITQKNHTPGLWLAPFCVSAHAQLAKHHPDWLLRDATGTPINHFTHWGNQPTYALDLTHPEAIAHLRHIIHTISRIWGYRYLKLDFLYAGAIHGCRHDPSITPIQAYRNGLRLIAEAAGPSVTLSGCGAPMLASVGLVDTMRVGSDTAHHWHSKPPSDCEPGALNAVRGVLARHWMNGTYWINDPDCAIVANLTNELSDAEIQTMLTVIALSGGNVFVSDRLGLLPPTRLNWLQRILVKQPKAAVPLQGTHQGLPNALYVKLPHQTDILARFNWSDHTLTWHYTPADWPDTKTFIRPHHLIESWPFRPTTFNPNQPSQTYTIPPHGVCLFSRHPLQPHPHLLATSHTLLGGYPFTYHTEHLPDAIRLTTPTPIRHPATALVSLPDPKEPSRPVYHQMTWPANQQTIRIDRQSPVQRL